MFKSRSTNGEIIIWYLAQTKAIKERSWREEAESQRKTQYVTLDGEKCFYLNFITSYLLSGPVTSPIRYQLIAHQRPNIPGH